MPSTVSAHRQSGERRETGNLQVQSIADAPVLVRIFTARDKCAAPRTAPRQRIRTPILPAALPWEFLVCNCQ